MSLVKCIECGNKVSEFAEMCPNCGCPIGIILNSKNNYCHKIKIDSGREYDLTDFDKTVDTETLQSVVSIARMLMHNYQIPGVDAKLIGDVIAFNNNQIPADYNEALEKMRASNRARRERAEASKPKCPHCQSTNIAKISGAERTMSVIGLGILSKKINKSFKCKSCGYTC